MWVHSSDSTQVIEDLLSCPVNNSNRRGEDGEGWSKHCTSIAFVALPVHGLASTHNRRLLDKCQYGFHFRLNSNKIRRIYLKLPWQTSISSNKPPWEGIYRRSRQHSSLFHKNTHTTKPLSATQHTRSQKGSLGSCFWSLLWKQRAGSPSRWDSGDQSWSHHATASGPGLSRGIAIHGK